MKLIQCIFGLCAIVLSISCSDSRDEEYQKLLTSTVLAKFLFRIEDQNQNNLLSNGSLEIEDFKINYPNYKGSSFLSVEEINGDKCLNFNLEKPNVKNVNRNENSDYQRAFETISNLEIKVKKFVLKCYHQGGSCLRKFFRYRQ